jgi:hypothetical protein
MLRPYISLLTLAVCGFWGTSVAEVGGGQDTAAPNSSSDPESVEQDSSAPKSQAAPSAQKPRIDGDIRSKQSETGTHSLAATKSIVDTTATTAETIGAGARAVAVGQGLAQPAKRVFEMGKKTGDGLGIVSRSIELGQAAHDVAKASEKGGKDAGLSVAKDRVEGMVGDYVTEKAVEGAGTLAGGKIGGAIASTCYKATKFLLENTECGQNIEKVRDETYIHALGLDKAPVRNRNKNLDPASGSPQPRAASMPNLDSDYKSQLRAGLQQSDQRMAEAKARALKQQAEEKEAARAAEQAKIADEGQAADELQEWKWRKADELARKHPVDYRARSGSSALGCNGNAVCEPATGK